jgi:hypothetical protein
MAPNAHPAIALRDLATQTLAEGRQDEAYALLAMAFSMAFSEPSAIPITCSVSAPGKLPRPLASPAHGLVRLTRQCALVMFQHGIELTPAMSLRNFGMFSVILSKLAPQLDVGTSKECIINFSDGCETEGDYSRIAFSCSRPDSVLVPDPHFFNSGNYSELRDFVRAHGRTWRERADVVFWRGASNGRPVKKIGEVGRGDWSWHQRLHLCDAAGKSRFRDRLDIGVVSTEAIIDGCLQRDVETAGFVKAPVTKHQFIEYKYLIDVDGWSNAWSLLEKMILGATILKIESAYGYRQWFYDRLRPWHHYIPILSDLSDLDAKLAWVFAMPGECERIAIQGAELAAALTLEGELADAETRMRQALKNVEFAVG